MDQQPQQGTKTSFLDAAGQPTIWGHVACSITIAALAGMVWVLTSWNVADLHRRWGFCQPLGLMGTVKTAPQPQAQGNQLNQTARPLRPSGIREVVWPWGSSHALINPNDLLNQTIFVVPTAAKGTGTDPKQDPEKTRLFAELNRQAGFVAYLEWRNCEITTYFLNRQLSTFSMATLMALLALGSLILISKKGWDKTNNTWINICISSGLVTVLAFNYSTLFGYIGARPNSDLFMTGYIRAADLSTRLRSAANTLSFERLNDEQTPPKRELLDLNKTASVITLIHALNQDIQEINVVNASFDASLMKKTGERFTNFADTEQGAQP